VKKTYKGYFQKSKVFIYPLLGIKKGVRFVPVQTYVSWNGYYTKDMNKFLCLYSIDKNNSEFKSFQDFHLKSHESFEEYHIIDDFNHLFVFDLSLFKKDILKFKEGKYSEFTEKTKEIISLFFGEKGTIAEYVESYLWPDYYYDEYSKMLDVDINVLMSVKELCDKPNFIKEDLKKDFVNVELFK
tara:strand:+ start:5508 stop:6062 length:555 start_codon:yes stop_codon:yes gene_type:complete